MFCLEPRGGYGFAKIFPLRGIGEWSSECGGLLRVGVAAFYAGKTHSSCASSKGHAPLFSVPNSWASTPPFGVSRLRALLIKTAASCDFGTNSRMPIKRACRSMSLSPNALYIMSGTEGISRLSIRAASSPFMTGMERSSTINSGRSCWAFSIASFPFSASPHTTRSASRWKRRAPCESKDCHPRSEQIYRIGSLAISSLAGCGFLFCFDLKFNFGPLFQSRFLAFLIRQRVLNANLPIQIIGFVNADLRFFGLCRMSWLDDLSLLISQRFARSFHTPL